LITDKFALPMHASWLSYFFSPQCYILNQNLQWEPLHILLQKFCLRRNMMARYVATFITWNSPNLWHFQNFPWRCCSFRL